MDNAVHMYALSFKNEHNNLYLHFNCVGREYQCDSSQPGFPTINIQMVIIEPGVYILQITKIIIIIWLAEKEIKKKKMKEKKNLERNLFSG